jgi:hypothetical protein
MTADLTQVVPLLKVKLTDPDANVRILSAYLIRALAETQPLAFTGMTDDLLSVAENGRPEDGAMAAGALALIARDPNSYVVIKERIAGLLKNGRTSEIRSFAVLAIVNSHAGDQTTLTLLQSTHEDPEGRYSAPARVLALEALYSAADRWRRARLVEDGIADRDASVRLRAARLLRTESALLDYVPLLAKVLSRLTAEVEVVPEVRELLKQAVAQHATVR